MMLVGVAATQQKDMNSNACAEALLRSPCSLYR